MLAPIIMITLLALLALVLWRACRSVRRECPTSSRYFDCTINGQRTIKAWIDGALVYHEVDGECLVGDEAARQRVEDRWGTA